MQEQTFNIKNLSNIQLELLKIYSQNVTEDDLFEIKKMLASYFANKATDAIDLFLEDKNLDKSIFDKWANEHSRA